MKLTLDSFTIVKLTKEEMHPVMGGLGAVDRACKSGNDSTNTTGIDSDDATADSDGD